jgi:hypothetical protein
MAFTNDSYIWPGWTRFVPLARSTVDKESRNRSNRIEANKELIELFGNCREKRRMHCLCLKVTKKLF